MSIGYFDIENSIMHSKNILVSGVNRPVYLRNIAFAACCAPVLLFSKLNTFFFRYFDPENVFFR